MADDCSADGQRIAALRCRALRVEYAGIPALADVDLLVGYGEVVALLGASGSGKSTLLNAVAGLVNPVQGEIWVAGQRVSADRHSTPPERRDVAMVFQDFALWPHLSVLESVTYPLRRAGLSRRDSAAAATDLLAILSIEHLASRRPAELSGGEQQRVGLARALARDAQLYLLDEPTAHLDTHLRSAFQDCVLARQSQSGAAVVYATHDAAEALARADRVAVLVNGMLVQLGSPTTVYAQPVSLAVAVLTGPHSVLGGIVGAAGDGVLSIDLGAGAMLVPGGGARSGAAAGPRQLMVRPDWVREGGPLRGRITTVDFRGPHTDYRLDTAAGTVLLHEPGPPRHVAGEPLSWRLERAWVLD